jgi:hypothetical protein
MCLEAAPRKNVDMHNADLTVMAVADLREDASAAEDAGVTIRARISPAGSYQRAPFYFIDASDLDEDQATLLASYRSHLEQPYGGIDHAVMTDALVTGQGTVITRDYCLVRESALEFLAAKRPPDGCINGPDGGMSLVAPPNRRIERPTLVLQRPWFGNYGHWLIDSAALLALVARVAMPADWQIVVGTQSPGMRSIVLETIARLAPGIDILERPSAETWEFASLHYLTPVHVPPLYKHPEALSCLRSLVVSGHLTAGAQTRRLFISRGDATTRRLVNEDEILGVCAEFGFMAVRPERLTLEAQAELFRSAKIIVGVKGAALTNVLFCTAGTHLITLSPSDFPDPFFWDLASQGGVHYSEIFGRLLTRTHAQGHGPFVVDPIRLRTILGAIEAEG